MKRTAYIFLSLIFLSSIFCTVAGCQDETRTRKELRQQSKQSIADCALPEKNKPLSTERVIELCRCYDIEYLIPEIETNPPAKQFFFDGASGCPEWLNKLIDHAAFRHDVKYWLGGSEEQRLISDYEFGIDVIKLCDRSAIESKIAFDAVRVGGSEILNLPWRWGFGR